MIYSRQARIYVASVPIRLTHVSKVTRGKSDHDLLHHTTGNCYLDDVIAEYLPHRPNVKYGFVHILILFVVIRIE